MILFNDLIRDIDVRTEYDALSQRYMFEPLGLSEDELTAQLKEKIVAAANELREICNVPGAALGVEIKANGVALDIPEEASHGSVAGLEAAVKEYIVHEAKYLWWQDVDARVANGSARRLLRGNVQQKYAELFPKPELVKREYEMEFVPEGKWVMK